MENLIIAFFFFTQEFGFYFVKFQKLSVSILHIYFLILKALYWSKLRQIYQFRSELILEKSLFVYYNISWDNRIFYGGLGMGWCVNNSRKKTYVFMGIGDMGIIPPPLLPKKYLTPLTLNMEFNAYPQCPIQPFK